MPHAFNLRQVSGGKWRGKIAGAQRYLRRHHSEGVGSVVSRWKEFVRAEAGLGEMPIHWIDEATYKRDTKNQREAESIIAKVAKYLNTQNGPPPEVGINDGVLMMAFPASVVPGLKKHRDLDFIFMQTPNASASFSDLRSGPIGRRLIQVRAGIPYYRPDDLMFILKGRRLDLIGNSAAWLIRKRGYSYESLQHELIHYLDSEKFKPGTVKGSGSILHHPGDAAETLTPEQEKKRLPKYHRHPMEFNAFYQTGASKWRRAVDKVIRSRRNRAWKLGQFKQLVPMTSQPRMSEMERWWDQEFLSSMWKSGLYRKKFLKRYALLWQGLRDDISNSVSRGR